MVLEEQKVLKKFDKRCFKKKNRRRVKKKLKKTVEKGGTKKESAEAGKYSRTDENRRLEEKEGQNEIVEGERCQLHKKVSR